MKKFLIYYSFIITSILTIIGIFGAASITQVVSALLFYPLVAFFLIQILPDKEVRALRLPVTVNNPKKEFGKVEKLHLDTSGKYDFDRRAFLKLIGSAGMSLFLFTLFTKKAEAAFFGSVPGPGTVSLKNTSGVQIDPAEKSPTDGYSISQVDADSSPAYYGYLDKNSNWYIVKENSDGSYVYAKGSSGFSTNWGNRATSLVYGTFDSVF